MSNGDYPQQPNEYPGELPMEYPDTQDPQEDYPDSTEPEPSQTPEPDA